MRITIVGAGAMGSLAAARLSLAMSASPTSATESHPATSIERVLLYGRPSDHLAAIAAGGLHMTELDGTTQTVAVETTSNPQDVRSSDVVIVLVKSWATAEAVTPLRPFLTRDTVVLTLQNGLGNASALRNALLAQGIRPHVWLGVTTQAAIRTAPGKLAHTGAGITAIGRRRDSANTSIQQLAETLSTAGWQTVAVDDIHRWVWRKLAVNCAINPLTALAGVPNAAISDDPKLATIARQLATETVAVAHARNVQIELANVLAAIDDVAQATGTNRSSMLVDLENNQRTEIDAINGAVVTEGARRRIPTPVNDIMVALVQARERNTMQGAVAHEVSTASAPED